MVEALPPPPPLPLNSKHDSKSKLVPVPGFGCRGQPIGSVDGDFYHYSVALSYDDGSPVNGKGIGRKVIDKLQENYDTDLAGKDFAYDGEKSLFTVGPLPQNKLEFSVILKDLSSNNAAVNGNPINEPSIEEGVWQRIKVGIRYVARIPMRATANALRSQGFYSSFRATQGGLSLNIDVSTTMIIQPGPVLDILVANQSARRMLKNLCINASPSNMEYKITGLSDEQLFSLKQRADGNAEGEVQMTEVTVYDYFVNHRHGQFRFSGDLSCTNVAKIKRPNYIPLEICLLACLQRYTKVLSTLQWSSFVEKSSQKPQERMSVLSNVLTTNNYVIDALLRAAGVSTNSSFPEIEGRVLSALKVDLSYDDGSPVDGKGIGGKVIDKLQETYDTELAGNDCAYDGEKSLFTVGPLPQNKLEFTVILEDLSSNKAELNRNSVNDSSLEEDDLKRIRRKFQSKSIKVRLTYIAMIPMREMVTHVEMSSHVEKSWPKPQGRMSVLCDASNTYGVNAFLRVTEVSSFTEIEGRGLSVPKLQVGSGEDFFHQSGIWKCSQKVQPTKSESWAVVNFSVCCDIKNVLRVLARCGQQKGINVEDPCAIIEENPQSRHACPLARVERMLQQIKSELKRLPGFLLCVLPEKKPSTIYGPWKNKLLVDLGIVTHCISPLRVNDQSLSTLILKMNAKVGGFSSLLAMEQSPCIPFVAALGGPNFGVPLKGTAIALAIVDGMILGMAEGRGRRDLKRSPLKKEGTQEGEEVLVVGEIMSGTDMKFLPLGKSAFVAASGANFSFFKVCEALKDLEVKDEHFTFEEALQVCFKIIQSILDKENFEASLSICGFENSKGPVIYTFRPMECGSICTNEDKFEVQREPLKLVAMGSASVYLIDYMRENLDAKHTPQDVLFCFESAVALCALEDDNCGGFISLAILDDSKCIIDCLKHSLCSLFMYYDRLGSVWDNCFLYLSSGFSYDLDFEREVEGLLGCVISEKFGTDCRFSTHVLGVDRTKKDIVGVVSFLDREEMKSIYEILSVYTCPGYTFYESSEENVWKFSSMFDCSAQARSGFF